MDPRPVTRRSGEGRCASFELRRPSAFHKPNQYAIPKQAPKGAPVEGATRSAVTQAARRVACVVAESETRYPVIRRSLEARSFAGRLAQGANTRACGPGGRSDSHGL